MKKLVRFISCIFVISILTSCSGKSEREKAEEAFHAVLEGYDEKAQYQLIYLNDDDIPELAVVTDWAHASGAELYAYIDGKADQLYVLSEDGYTDTQFGSWGTFFYVERQGKVIHLYDLNFGAGETGFVCAWDGTSAEMSILYTYGIHIEYFDEGIDYATTYYIDGEQVPYEDYSKATELLDYAERFGYQ